MGLYKLTGTIPLTAYWGYTYGLPYLGDTNGLGLYQWTGAIPMDWGYNNGLLAGIIRRDSNCTNELPTGALPMDYVYWGISINCLLGLCQWTDYWGYTNGLSTGVSPLDSLMGLYQ